MQLSINNTVEANAIGFEPQNVPGSKCQCFYQGHQEKWMPFPCIQTVGAKFRLYAGKTRHDFKHGARAVLGLCGAVASLVHEVRLASGMCKHHVCLLYAADMSHSPYASALTCTALVQSCAWELCARPPLLAAPVAPEGYVNTSEAWRSSHDTSSGRRPGSSGNNGSGRRNDGPRRGSDNNQRGGARAPKSKAGAKAGRQHMGEAQHAFARFGRGVYAAGAPKLEDVLALNATGLFEALHPMIVGIPKLGGPTPSAIESEDVSRRVQCWCTSTAVWVLTRASVAGLSCSCVHSSPPGLEARRGHQGPSCRARVAGSGYPPPREHVCQGAQCAAGGPTEGGR